ncbi:MAG: small basic protein [Candidatus Omnitrophota bacterium]
MSQHPSLRSSEKDKQQRSVLKRFERIETLKKKDLWQEDKNSAFGLPKVKVMRFKVKKEKSKGTADATKAGAKTAEAKPAAGKSSDTKKQSPAKK